MGISRSYKIMISWVARAKGVINLHVVVLLTLYSADVCTMLISYFWIYIQKDVEILFTLKSTAELSSRNVASDYKSSMIVDVYNNVYVIIINHRCPLSENFNLNILNS